MSDQPYEKPSVEDISGGGYPIETVAGVSSV
jgi:hypothetical protein